MCVCVHDSECFDSGFGGIEDSVQRFIRVVRQEHSIGALVCFAFKGELDSNASDGLRDGGRSIVVR